MRDGSVCQQQFVVNCLQNTAIVSADENNARVASPYFSTNDLAFAHA